MRVYAALFLIAVTASSVGAAPARLTIGQRVRASWHLFQAGRLERKIAKQEKIGTARVKAVRSELAKRGLDTKAEAFVASPLRRKMVAHALVAARLLQNAKPGSRWEAKRMAVAGAFGTYEQRDSVAPRELKTANGIAPRDVNRRGETLARGIVISTSALKNRALATEVVAHELKHDRYVATINRAAAEWRRLDRSKPKTAAGRKQKADRMEHLAKIADIQTEEYRAFKTGNYARGITGQRLDGEHHRGLEHHYDNHWPTSYPSPFDVAQANVDGYLLGAKKAMGDHAAMKRAVGEERSALNRRVDAYLSGFRSTLDAEKGVAFYGAPPPTKPPGKIAGLLNMAKGYARLPAAWLANRRAEHGQRTQRIESEMEAYTLGRKDAAANLPATGRVDQLLATPAP